MASKSSSHLNSWYLEVEKNMEEYEWEFHGLNLELEHTTYTQI